MPRVKLWPILPWIYNRTRSVVVTRTMEATRLRVVFEDRHILSESQKSEGLKRSWLLLKPQHDTISDLSSYVAHIFDLHRSCPHGIKLSVSSVLSITMYYITCTSKYCFACQKDRESTVWLVLLFCPVGCVWIMDLVEEKDKELVVCCSLCR